MSDTGRQSIDEYISKFKGPMSCKLYTKNKPIKWCFKWWCGCCSKTGYLYELDLYLGKKKKTELGESCFGFVYEVRKYTLYALF